MEGKWRIIEGNKGNGEWIRARKEGG
jgi:hypothetical protein